MTSTQRKAQQRLFFLCQLKKFGMAQELLTSFYTATIESVLCSSILVCFVSASGGVCSDSDCHPNATCGEFGGFQQCTCKEGFVGNGSYCEDINECQNDSNNICYPYTCGKCVNTIGSYYCTCYSGSMLTNDYGCVDIDECANSSLNDCSPLAICTNYQRFYTCTCSYGYYGDGRHCEVNECQQGTPCGKDKDCFKSLGSYSCVNPCSNYTVLNDPWRSPSYGYYGYCDAGLQGWYRFKGDFNQQIPEWCVPSYSCGSYAPIWIKGSHPTVRDGTVNRTVCANWNGNCCLWSNTISVKMCPGDFYVYKLLGTPNSYCYLTYCTESSNNCSGLHCASDEQCVNINGVPGCNCISSLQSIVGINADNIAGYIKPQVTCGLEYIEVLLSRCLLEKLGYNSSSIYLKDNSCRGVILRKDKSYISLITKPTNGYCSGILWNNGSEMTYKNTVYLSAVYDGVIKRGDYSIDFHCTYPRNMTVNLISGISPIVGSATIDVGGTSNYTLMMGLFQDSGYTNPFMGLEVILNSTATLYIGIVTTGASSSSKFVLIMNRCFATPTASTSYGPTYHIIQNQCPNRIDPTISVLENGVSLKGRISLQVFQFLGGQSQVYLHCEVGLCDTSTTNCRASCPASRMGIPSNEMRTTSITTGPIKLGTSVPSTGGESAMAAGKLFISTIAFLMLLLWH
ncbi:uromodulin-like [Hyperolius riggenbachi]|uniref:uromodulin-like n=1 Tax=Hyperolius riggenbachi TaxID=752182 RepID=UPI0035A2E893